MSYQRVLSTAEQSHLPLSTRVYSSLTATTLLLKTSVLLHYRIFHRHLPLNKELLALFCLVRSSGSVYIQMPLHSLLQLFFGSIFH
jgi:hypothetical protein